MDAFFFGYTLAILALCLSSSVIQVLAFEATKRRPFIAAGAFFFSYFIELGVIFLDEYLHQNIEFPVDSYYAITYPLTRTLIACVLWGSLWAYVLFAVERFSGKRLVIPVALFLGAQLACLWLMEQGAPRQFCYYTCRQAFCLFMALYGLSTMHRAPTAQERQWLGRHLWLMWVLLVEVVLVCLEDALVILVLPPAKELGLTLYLSERNFCENAMVVVFAFFTGRAAWHELSFRMRPHPQAQPQAQPLRPSLPINPTPSTSTSAGAAAQAAAGTPATSPAEKCAPFSAGAFGRSKAKRSEGGSKAGSASADRAAVGGAAAENEAAGNLGAAIMAPANGAMGNATIADATFSAHVDELMPRFGADHGLTPREEEVLALVLAGRTNQQIADALVVSVGTVKTHVYHIVHKCNVETRSQLKTLFWAP